MNKKILGLDIGTTSIGWAIVEATKQKPLKDNQYFKGESPETKTDTNNQRTGLHYKDDLPAVGVRIISQGKMGSRFDTGKKLNEKKEKTPTKERRDFRSARKTKSRYKLRRDKLCIVLDALKMLPDDSYSNENEKKVWKPVEKKNNNWYTNDKGNRESDIGEALYKLRTDALNPENEISLKDWGRILLHLNQWRGYSSDRFSNNEDSEAEDGFYTSMVNDDVVEIKRTYKDRHNKKLDKIYYQLKFENGDIGVDVVKVGENSFYSRFKKGEVATYKKSYDDEDKNTTYFIWQNLKKEAWAYQKWLINDGIEKYLKENILASVGSYFYQKHYVEKSLSRIRTNTINRGWYEDEFDKIWKVQFERYKNKFTAEVVKQCIDAAFKKDESVKKELLKLPTLEKQLKALIRDKIIYYQRSWQQSKNKGECRFEKIPDIKKDKDNKTIPHKDGKDHWKGRTVIPRSHPLHQEFKLWQQINNVRIWFHSVNEKEIELMENETKCKDKLGKTPNQIKELLYERLQQKKEQSWRTFVNEIFPDINIKLKKATDKGTTKEKYFSVNYIKLSKKTTDEQDNLLKGNKTKVQIREILIDKSNEWFITNNAGVNKKREEKSNNENKRASCLVPISNFQLLWEIIYDITGFKAGNEKANIELITRKIRNHFDAETITDEQCVLLAKIKFDDSGMGNLSARAIRKMLPLMACSKYADQYPLNEKVKAQIEKLIILNQQEQNETNDELKLYSLKEFIPDKKARIKLSEKMSEDEFKGLNYWEAAAVVYGTHSKPGVINRTQDEIKEAVRNLLPVKPSSMNNPVVEKIVNETLKMVQLLYNTYGFDELRIELSRELKNSREEREAIWDAQNNNRKRNEFAKKMLREMFNDEDISELDLKTSNRNIEKIKIVEDVVGNLNPKKHAEKRKEYKISEPTKAEVKNYRIWLQQNFKCPYTNELIPFSDVFSKNDVIQREHIIPKERYPDNSYSNIVLTWKEVNNAKAENGNRTAFEFIDSKRDRETVNVSGKGDLKLVLKEQWEEHVHKMFGKGRKAKNLLRKSIPEDPVNRELKDTQYINKKLREKLGEIFGFDKVWTTTGQVTDMLRDSWHLNEKVMQELIKNRFEKFKPPMGKGTTMESIPEYSIIYPNTVKDVKTNRDIIVSKFPGFHKRLDHRHHALDAIIVACTRQQHIQYINNLNASNSADIDDADEKKQKYNAIKKEICEGNSSTKYKTPWEVDDFMQQVKDALQQIIVSHKNSNVLISPSKNKEIDKNNYTSFSIRAKLHNETFVGKRKVFDKGTRTFVDTPVKRGNESVGNISPEKVIDLRTKRHFRYRQDWMEEIEAEWERYKNEKESDEKKSIEQKRKLVNNFTEHPIYYNAIYDVRLKDGSWKPLFEYDRDKIFDEIEYRKYNHNKRKIASDVDIERTEKIKQLIKNYAHELNRENILLKHPLFLDDNKKIVIKRATVENRTGNESLIEIRHKTFVSTKEKFRVIVTEDKNTKKKHFKFIDHLTALNFRKELAANNSAKEFIEAEFKIPKDRIPANDNFLFTLSKNDLVYLPQDSEAINWNNIKSLSDNLFLVSSFDEKGEYVVLEKHTVAEPIKLNDINDASGLAIELQKANEKYVLENEEYEEENKQIEEKKAKYSVWKKSLDKDELKFQKDAIVAKEKEIKEDEKRLKEHKKEIESLSKQINNLKTTIAFKPKDDKPASPIEESVEIKNDATQQKLIKVFTDKLGKKIIPFWEFPNGCWDKNTAIKLGLIIAK